MAWFKSRNYSIDDPKDHSNIIGLKIYHSLLELHHYQYIATIFTKFFLKKYLFPWKIDIIKRLV